MKSPCKNCPFKRGMGWMGARGSGHNAESKIFALQETDKCGGFSCHKTNPDANVFFGKPMTNHDCAGFKMMLENMNQPNKNPHIVNEFNETLPVYDLRYWANKENYISNLKLI